MADTKPGLDLSKLLGSAKKPAAQATSPEAVPEQVPAPVAEPATKGAGLDLSRLVATAKQTSPPAVPAAASDKPAGPVQLSGKLSFSQSAEPARTPAKPLGVGGQRVQGQVGQAGGVSKAATAGRLAGAFAAPAPAQAEPAKALNTAAPSNRKLEKQVSRQGLETDRLNVVQKEERRYPAGAFGADELFLYIQDMMNVLRANLWRALPEYPRFVTGLKIVGSVRRDAFAEWDGTALSGVLDSPPSEPTAYWVLDADDLIDNVRGKLSCVMHQTAPHMEPHGDAHLGRVVRFVSVPVDREQMDDVREREAQKLAHRMELRHACKTPAEWLEKMVVMRIETAAKFIDEPIFVRLTLEEETKQEILFHVEKGKLTTLVGKPGETLAPGALEVTVGPKAVKALWDMECDWPFLFSIGLARASGDLDLLSRLYWVNFEIVRRIRMFNHTQKMPGPDNPYWIDVRLEPKK